MTGTLADRQAAFLRAILDEGEPLPAGWGNRQAIGMSVYRGNYRSALIGAIESTFERTRRYVGDGPFKQAAINHAISHPPFGWTIDAVGAGFEETCAALYTENPEVADLAWLEWSMLELATAPNSQIFGPEAFGAATTDFGDEDWMSLGLQFQPRSTARVISTNLTGLWPALEEGYDGDFPAARLDEPRGCLVWREGERPTFKLVDPDNAKAFLAMQEGATYGDVLGLLAGDDPDGEAVQDAAMRAGAFLGDWLQEGLVTGIAS